MMFCLWKSFVRIQRFVSNFWLLGIIERNQSTRDLYILNCVITQHNLIDWSWKVKFKIKYFLKNFSNDFRWLNWQVNNHFPVQIPIYAIFWGIFKSTSQAGSWKVAFWILQLYVYTTYNVNSEALLIKSGWQHAYMAILRGYVLLMPRDLS